MTGCTTKIFNVDRIFADNSGPGAQKASSLTVPAVKDHQTTLWRRLPAPRSGVARMRLAALF